MREIPELSVFNKKRNTYRIKVYKDVKVNLTTLDGLSTITLFNIVYVSNYFTNIVVIGRLSRRGIY